MSNPASPAKGSTDDLILVKLAWMDGFGAKVWICVGDCGSSYNYPV